MCVKGFGRTSLGPGYWPVLKITISLDPMARPSPQPFLGRHRPITSSGSLIAAVRGLKACLSATCPTPRPLWDAVGRGSRDIHPSNIGLKGNSPATATGRGVGSFFWTSKIFSDVRFFKQANPSHTDRAPVWDECGTGGVVGRRSVHLLAVNARRWIVVITMFPFITQTY